MVFKQFFFEFAINLFDFSMSCAINFCLCSPAHSVLAYAHSVQPIGTEWATQKFVGGCTHQ